MRSLHEFRPSSDICTTIVLVACLVLLSVARVSAQKTQASAASQPKYDLKTEAKLKGIVDELKLPPKGFEKEAAHLLMKNGTDTLDVYLCPGSFLHDMGISFSKGDEIALTGSKIRQDRADLILAREVVKGTDTLLLRDEKGNPVWNWQR
jgi:hypothetical protein